MKYIQNILIVLLALSLWDFIGTNFYQDNANKEINGKLDALLEKITTIDHSKLGELSVNQKNLTDLKKYNANLENKIYEINPELVKKDIKGREKSYLKKDLNDNNLYRKNILSSLKLLYKKINLSIPKITQKNTKFIEGGLDFISSKLMTKGFSLKIEKLFIYKEKFNYILELKLSTDIQNIYALINQLKLFSSSSYYFIFKHLFISNDFTYPNKIDKNAKELLSKRVDVNYLGSSLYMKAIIVLKNETL